MAFCPCTLYSSAVSRDGAACPDEAAAMAVHPSCPFCKLTEIFPIRAFRLQSIAVVSVPGSRRFLAGGTLSGGSLGGRALWSMHHRFPGDDGVLWAVDRWGKGKLEGAQVGWVSAPPPCSVFGEVDAFHFCWSQQVRRALAEGGRRRSWGASLPSAVPSSLGPRLQLCQMPTISVSLHPACVNTSSLLLIF